MKIDWGTILLFGGGLSFGELMFETKVAEALGESLTNMTGLSGLWSLTALAVALGIVLSELSSNTAAANMLIPVVIALAWHTEVDPLARSGRRAWGPVMASCCPYPPPPTRSHMARALCPSPAWPAPGVLFDLCGFVVIVLGRRLLWPPLGH